ncbi:MULTISPECIES: hypothetical protein [Paenibacillus]|uniref:hypothetical protein n=1 Tax=Paenibacillus TaxID=44249 RepID=UPI0004F820DF|nr:hypothetical protein [Paenibacillus odorifer]AIQ75150.1 hypothetical protein PODO_18820 [Paenibacillus odorifer]MEC0129902.1 hypothetical protein [Paenibacillus odorifer]MEC0223855.1 hypothetical protein [Paenibacillus odorifer]OMD18787.1 hypothetical protein BJP50_12935 [Paenibacillus odorifer]
MKKCEYVIKEVNEPSGKALRQFHEHVTEILSHTVQAEAEKTYHSPSESFYARQSEKLTK